MIFDSMPLHLQSSSHKHRLVSQSLVDQIATIPLSRTESSWTKAPPLPVTGHAPETSKCQRTSSSCSPVRPANMYCATWARAEHASIDGWTMCVLSESPSGRVESSMASHGKSSNGIQFCRHSFYHASHGVRRAHLQLETREPKSSKTP